MSFSTRSCSSFDTDDFIDLDTALVDEELRSLGATPETRDYYNNNYRISFKSVDAKETERLRNTLVTPMTCCSYTPRSLLKSPTDSYAESVALFKNLANNDHIDLFSNDLQDFMDNCDIDGLLSRPATRPNSSSSYRHKNDSLTSSRLSSHNEVQQKNQEYCTLLKKLSEPNQHRTHHPTQKDQVESPPFGHTSNGYTPSHLPTISSHYKPKSRTIESILNKRRSIDSDGFKQLQQNNVEPTLNESKTVPKRHSMMSIGELHVPEKSKLPTSRIPSTVSKYPTLQRRNSNLQQPVASNEAAKRRNSNLPAAINTSLQRRNSNLPTAPNTSLQRRNSNLQQPTASNTSLQRRNSNLQQPTAPNTSLQRRNSNLQQQNQQDQRRWSSNISDHSQKTINSQDKAPQKEINNLQRKNSIENQHVPSRHEPRKLSNRHSMIVPTSRRLSRENIYENVQSSSATRRNASYEDDTLEVNPSSNTDLDLSVNVRRRHTISASDKRASIGQVFKQAVDKRASLYGPNHIQVDPIQESYFQDNADQQLQNTHTQSSNRRSYSKTSSYEKSTDEPNRYRSTLRNPYVDNTDQLSSTLRNTVLANSKYSSPHESQHQARSSMYNDLNAQSDIDEDAYYRRRVVDLGPNQEVQQDEEHMLPPPRYSSRVNAEQRHGQLPAIAAHRRHRAATQQREDENNYTDKPSLMPVPVRYRMHSNNSLSKYVSVPENAGLTSFSPPKDARYNSSTMHGYPEEIQVEPSRSSGGLSNSTTSSSHSSDRYYDPPTPPTRAVVTQHHSKRRSIPVFNASMIDEQICKTENRHSSYLNRITNDNGSIDYEQSLPSHRLLPRRQRVVSEDNENYKHQFEQRHKSQQIYRQEDTADVISSARHLLSIVKERRNRRSLNINTHL